MVILFIPPTGDISISESLCLGMLSRQLVSWSNHMYSRFTKSLLKYISKLKVHWLFFPGVIGNLAYFPVASLISVGLGQWGTSFTSFLMTSDFKFLLYWILNLLSSQPFICFLSGLFCTISLWFLLPKSLYYQSISESRLRVKQFSPKAMGPKGEFYEILSLFAGI